MSSSPSAADHLFAIASHARALLRILFSPGPHAVFLTPDALAINRARQDHLASLGLDLANTRVLEIGAGIGLHMPFFLERGCDVVVSDGNAGNVSKLRWRYPKLQVEQLDLEEDRELRWLGQFNIVYCCRLLYHLSEPERAICRILNQPEKALHA